MAGGGREDRLRPSRRSKEAGPGPVVADVAKAPKPDVAGAGAVCIPENKSRLLVGAGVGAAAGGPPNKSMSLLAGTGVGAEPPPENAELKSAKSSSAFTLDILLLSRASAS